LADIAWPGQGAIFSESIMTVVSLVPKAPGPKDLPRVIASSTAPAHPAPADPQLFRQALRQLAGGVSVITTGRGAARTGLVATSVSSLSAEPPTLMFGLNLASSSFPVLRAHGAFAVNLLAADQKPIADRFAGRGGEKGLARYAEASWTEGASGSALLDGALANLDCEIEELIERHSHAIVIGRIREIRIGSESAALLYWRGAYERLGWLPDEAASALGLRAY
jgi:flavin reductase (DIM6/NTAB) family NADH-FMN oxidoreductase RutF